MTFTLQQTLDSIERAVATCDQPGVLTSSDAGFKCVYTGPHGEPVCAVGRVVADLGGSLPGFGSSSNTGPVRYSSVGEQFQPDALAVVAYLQQVQDLVRDALPLSETYRLAAFAAFVDAITPSWRQELGVSQVVRFAIEDVLELLAVSA